MFRRTLDLRIGIPLAVAVGAILAALLDPLSIVIALPRVVGPLTGLVVIWSIVRWVNFRDAPRSFIASFPHPVWILVTGVLSLSISCSLLMPVRKFWADFQSYPTWFLWVIASTMRIWRGFEH